MIIEEKSVDELVTSIKEKRNKIYTLFLKQYSDEIAKIDPNIPFDDICNIDHINTFVENNIIGGFDYIGLYINSSKLEKLKFFNSIKHNNLYCVIFFNELFDNVSDENLSNNIKELCPGEILQKYIEISTAYIKNDH